MFRLTGPNTYKFAIESPTTDASHHAMLTESVRLQSLKDHVSHSQAALLQIAVTQSLWTHRQYTARALWMYAKVRRFWPLLVVAAGAAFFDVEIRPRVGREVEDWPGRDGIERRVVPITVESV